MLQLACQWNLAHAPVRCVAPTLIQEAGRTPGRSRTSAPSWRRVPPCSPLSDQEVREIAAIGDNSGCMALKGASPEYSGGPAADRWCLDSELSAVAARWDIDPGRDLVKHELSAVDR